jgi:predicted naringenin-chalcone synthase
MRDSVSTMLSPAPAAARHGAAAVSSRIVGIASAVPDFEFPQGLASDLAVALLHGRGGRDGKGLDPRLAAMLKRVYERSGIDRRRSVLPDFGCDPAERLLFPAAADFRPEPSTAKRNAVYGKEAPILAGRAVARLIEETGEDPAGITHLVTASCTGFAAPGWDYALMKDLPLPASTARFNIGFMGCFASFPALRLADHIARSEPKARVLVVALELCSLHYAIDGSNEALVANALFADGAAAALVTADAPAHDRVGVPGSRKPSLRIGPFASRVIPDTADEMAWTIGETGFSMKLSSRVAKSLGEEAPSLIDRTLAAGGSERRDVRHWAIHPGGRAILDAFEKALDLDEDGLRHSRAVLREHGNMSSPTVLFVLERMLREGLPGRVFASAFGPGLTAETCLLDLEA